MESYSVAEKARIVAATQQGAGKCDVSRKDTAEMYECSDWEFPGCRRVVCVADEPP